MESAVEALKMAAAVLIFVIAIFSSFSLFGTAKETADSIIRIRDKQAYLQAADLGEGLLYTSSQDISGGKIGGVTTSGDRIVEIQDIISTIYRYSIEKYGVTIMDSEGNIIARYDSNTEQIMNTWNGMTTESKEKYIDLLEEHTKNDYANNPQFSKSKLEELFAIKISGINSVGAPWYGNEIEIKKRIACDLAKTPANRTYTYNNQTYEGQDILPKLVGKTIVEVTKEIDNSTYLKDGSEETNLLQEYAMPTIEVIYIIL